MASSITQVDLRKDVESTLRLLVGGERELHPGSVGVLPPIDSFVRLLEILGPDAGQRVLVVGLPNSPLIAVLSRIVREVCVVVRRRTDRKELRRQLVQVGGGNVRIRTDRKLRSFEGSGPFDRIVAAQLPEAELDGLRYELCTGGVLLTLRRTPHGAARPLRLRRVADQAFESESLAELSLEAELADVLSLLDLVDAPVLEQAKRLGGDGPHLASYLRDRGLLGEVDLCFAHALLHGLGHASVEHLMEELDLEIVRSMPRVFLQHQGLLPLRATEDRIVLALTDPTVDLTEIGHAFQPRRLAPYLVGDSDYRRLWNSIDLLEQHAGSSRGGDSEDAEASDAAGTLTLVEVEGEAAVDGRGAESQASALHFESLIIDAIARRASDIHLEFARNGTRIRLRIDGVLVPYEVMQLAPAELLRLVNVFKIHAAMDISERRLPQGGSTRVRLNKTLFDLRVQTQPSMFGENAVVRILPQDMRVQSVEELGFPQAAAHSYSRLLRDPNGLVLVVGPTGSGKSTTLYAGLQLLAEDGERKIVTVEDPIEYCLTRVQQSQVNVAAGFRFSDAIRSFLRQDPDVMLVGEIRDSETAQEALRASQTGHLVLSTLHCNEATDAPQRLADLGQDVPSIASELRAVLAQRLARRICKSCRADAAPDRELLGLVFPAGVPDGWRSWYGRGCARCHGTGVHGRISVIEFLRFDERLREAFLRGATGGELRALAQGGDFVGMRERALELVANGIVALADLPRFLPLHRLCPES